MVVIIGDNTWGVTSVVANNMINTAKENFKRKKANAIVALEKGNVIEMRKDVFKDKNELHKAVDEYKASGFIVHCVQA